MDVSALSYLMTLQNYIPAQGGTTGMDREFQDMISGALQSQRPDRTDTPGEKSDTGGKSSSEEGTGTPALEADDATLAAAVLQSSTPMPQIAPVPEELEPVQMERVGLQSLEEQAQPVSAEPFTPEPVIQGTQPIFQVAEPAEPMIVSASLETTDGPDGETEIPVPQPEVPLIIGQMHLPEEREDRLESMIQQASEGLRESQPTAKDTAPEPVRMETQERPEPPIKADKAPEPPLRETVSESRPAKSATSREDLAVDLDTGEAPTVQQAPELEDGPTGARQPSQAKQIEMEILRNMEEQRMEFRMQLEPQELGKIDVRMVLENGRLAVELLAANNRTAELLRHQMEHLTTSLRSSDVELTTVQVVTGTQAGSAHMESAFTMDESPSQSGEESQGRVPRGSGTDQLDDFYTEAPPEWSDPSSRLNYAV